MPRETLASLTWPCEDKPRNDSRWWCAAWLVGRHPQLARLLERVPGVASVEPDDDVPDAQFDLLAQAFTLLDERARKWTEATRYSHAPEDDEAFDRWQRAHGIPELSPVAAAIAPMSGGEQRRLRLLATMSADRVPWSLGDLFGLDDAGAGIVADWTRVVLWHVTGQWTDAPARPAPTPCSACGGETAAPIEGARLCMDCGLVQ